MMLVRMQRLPHVVMRRAVAVPLQRRRRSTLRDMQAQQMHPYVLHSYGEGFLGALGTGSYEDVAAPTPLSTTHDLAVAELSAGWAHAGFITAQGDAYQYGRTHSFRDVIRATNMQRLAPRLVSWLNAFTRLNGIDELEPARITLPEGERVKKMVCSTALTFLLTESGKLFTLGANGYGQCGTGADSVSVNTAEQIVLGDGETDEGDTVVDIAAGYQHGLAVTARGGVFAWGKGERGQLGFGTANIMAPQEVIALKDRQIVSVSAGFNHSSAVTRDGELFLWGKLLNPEATDESNADQVTPRLIKTRAPVRLLQCSHFHTTYITEDNKVWVVGRTPSGRREQGDRLVAVSSEMHTMPFQVTNHGGLDVSKVLKLGKGIDKTSFVTKDGQAFEWISGAGIQRVAGTEHLRVRSLESGFRYRLLLASEQSNR